MTTKQQTGAVTWMAERVRFGDLLPNAASYTVNPLTVAAPFFPPLSASDTDIDALVWVIYTSEAQYCSMFRPGLRARRVGQLTGLRAIGEAVGLPYYDGHGGFTE
jgi:hypothetical protein